MAKVNFKDNESLQDAQNKTNGIISYRKMKEGQVVVAKWPSKKKINKRSIKKLLKI